ncbi:MAG: PEP-CTERM-box response regulator transcription factor [Candidatus Rokuibacteriota bacterium]|nr:MAG: PEP-CTERM-box response regulator transcription factor [Candidatus Rokubacteria bacterium]
MERERLLIIEDDEDIRTQLTYALQDEYDVSVAGDRTRAAAAVQEAPPEIVTLDLGLPPTPDTAEEGLRALEDILAVAPEAKVIIITGNGDRANAVAAVERGAFDYHLKPVNLDDLKVVLRRATYLRQLERESEEQARQREDSIRFTDILGSTPKMREIFGVIQRVAKTDATVLCEGESGTGKELVARAVHTHSPRKSGPFVAINCGAIPETLLESELFGHERGSFTGAHAQRKGKIEMATGGTLFLDEITEMSLPLQVKLLRFLQQREIERVGGREVIPIDVRVVAATNQSLDEALRGGRFREDLYYRLSVVTIHLPPLRERGEDVVLLANAFLRRNAQALKRKVRFSPEALEAIVKYQWPGNIRELENKVHRAVIMATSRIIGSADLDLNPSAVIDALPTLREARDQSERRLIVNALVRSRGNISRAARVLDISRPTFHDMLVKHSIDAKEFR